MADRISRILKKLFLWIGCAAFFLALTLGLSEIYFRWAKLAPDNGDRFFEPYLMTGDFIHSEEYSPETYGYERRGFEYYYTFRKHTASILDRDFTDAAKIKVPDHRKLVLVVGASVALGDHGSFPNKWWKILQRSLRQDLNDNQITVAPEAMRSWVSTQERIALELFGFPRKPAAVVIIDGANDVTNAGLLARPGDPYNQGTLYARYYSLSFQLLRELSNHSTMIRYFLLRNIRNEEDQIMREVAGDPKRQQYVSSDTASVYLDNVREMARRCAQENIPCYFFLQPDRALTLKYNDPARPESEEEVIYQEILRRSRAFHGRLSRTARFYDLTHLLDQHVRYYVDGVHFSDPGQALMARSVEEVLIKNHALR